MPTSFHFCFVESGYPHPHGGGGAGSYVQTVARELVRRGHKVSVVTAHCPQCPTESRDQGVRVYRPLLKSGWHWYVSKLPVMRTLALTLRTLEHGWLKYRFLEKLHRATPIDLVEFTEGGDFWHALRTPFPYVSHLHGSRYTVKRASGVAVDRSEWFNRRVELFGIQRAAWVFSPSRELLRLVTAELGSSLKRTIVLPYPLDPELLRVKAETQERASSNGKHVLFAARHDPVKGADVLLQAVPLVRTSVPEATFDFYGYQPHPGERLPEGVVCHGFLPKAELLQRYHTADLCVLPSRWDNSPNAVYEAMAAGRAVVASRVGGIPELVADGETGVLVPPGDPERLAQAIVKLLTYDEERIRMGQRGRERIQQLADLEKNVDQRLAIYSQVIEEFAQSL
jgi:glycosyltransferase involved in cell wall biosynthesis